VEHMNVEKDGSVKDRVLTVRDMLAPLFRHRRAVLLTFGLIFTLAVIVAWAWADSYYIATMQVVVGRDRSDPAVTSQQSGSAGNNVVTTDDVASEVALLQGRDILREVAQTCSIVSEDSFWNPFEPRDPELKKAARLERATKALARKLKVEAQKTSHVIDIRYGKSGPPETPACVLQNLGKLYLEKHLRLQRPAGAYDFFAQQTDRYQSALAVSEKRLEDFSKARRVAAPEVMRAETAQQLVTARTNLYTARQAIAADEQRIENIRNQMAQTPSRSSTSEATLSAGSLVDQLQASLLALQLKRTELLTSYHPSYPLVKECEQEITETTDAIARAEQASHLNKTTDRDPTFEYLRQDRAKTEADLASERATAEALVATINGMQNEVVSLDSETVKQGSLLREAKANEGNYLLYLNKREQERTSDALDEKRMANVAIAVPAYVPALPAYSPLLVTMVGFFAAGLAGIGAGYLAEFVDQSFRTPDEVTNLLKISVLAAVPRQAA
jgi:succinoglycan biosynthesis transport protein ExoP